MWAQQCRCSQAPSCNTAARLAMSMCTHCCCCITTAHTHPHHRCRNHTLVHCRIVCCARLPANILDVYTVQISIAHFVRVLPLAVAQCRLVDLLPCMWGGYAWHNLCFPRAPFDIDHAFRSVSCQLPCLKYVRLIHIIMCMAIIFVCQGGWNSLPCLCCKPWHVLC